MHDLTLVGVHPDGEHLVLSGGDGQRYRVLVDDALRAAVRRDRARLGQLQIAMGGALRPRDIQARIRAGESAAEIAAAAGLPVEHVRRYEGAVLAEREHVARQAQSLPVRRRQGQAPSLDEVVHERLSARDADAHREWDAWRREDSGWTVRLVFRTGSKDRTAHWRVDLATGALESLDDEARWLTADTDGDSGPVGGRRLSPVRERVYDVEADGGVREHPGPADVPQAQPVEPAERDRRRTVDLLETLRGRRGRRQPVAPPEGEPSADDLFDESPGGTDRHDADLDDAAGGQLLGDEVFGSLGDRDGEGAAVLLDEAELALAMRLADEAPAAHPPASRPQDATDARILALPPAQPAEEPGQDEGSGPGEDGGHAEAGGGSGGDAADASDAEAVLDLDAATGTATAAEAAPARARTRSKRAAVPSWDDVVFGARRDS